MKKKLNIYAEVVEILKRRGFIVFWVGGHRHCASKRGPSSWWDRYETCNWIIKK